MSTKNTKNSAAKTKSSKPLPLARPVAAVILAAGEGSRMKSRLTKMLHPVGGRPLVEHVARAALSAGAAPVVVIVGVQGDAVRQHLEQALPGAPLLFAEQTERLGTGDAVKRAQRALQRFAGDVLILCGDVPALPSAALVDLLGQHREQRAALTVLSAELADPTGYGRIVRNAAGQLQQIVEHRDANVRQRKIREINSGTYVADWEALSAALDQLRPDNDQGEYYLTDAVRILLRGKRRCAAIVHPRAAEALGVNSRRQLADMEQIVAARVLGGWMDAGVTIVDPATTWVDITVEIGQDTTIHPGVTLAGRTVIGRECVIRSGCRLENVVVGDGSEILDHVIAIDSTIGADCHVGPFAHLRPGSVLQGKNKIGNFVETKKTRLGVGSKAPHLSYLGDAEIGEKVNVGAGTITCNYDGVNKHKTVLEDGVFIGSDTQLIAPVHVGKGAYVGAGSTITKDVPADSLALSRSEQRTIEGWAARRREALGATGRKS